MPKIQFVKNIPVIEVETGANLMDSLLGAGLPVASSCNGDGVCSKCRIKVLGGAENISKIGALEQSLHDRNRIQTGIRIACQSEVMGDITIDTDYW